MSASIIPGSAIGLVSFIVRSSNLPTVTLGNQMHKYTDDTYTVIPACNVLSREGERSNTTKKQLDSFRLVIAVDRQ